jgi:hypothetical protein
MLAALKTTERIDSQVSKNRPRLKLAAEEYSALRLQVLERDG